MRFRTTKLRVEEKNWSVILSPLRNELDKKRVAEKISELFQISYEDSRELVQSTPMMLLDELAQAVAQKIQSIFQEVRADVTLTNDPLVKRRCYRAVWPDRPRLSFLNSSSLQNSPAKPAPEMSSETVVETLAAPVIPAPPMVSPETSPSQDLEKKCRELEMLHEEKTREIEELKRALEKELKKESEKNAVELRAAIEEWEERYQTLKEEYGESKIIYEEKILAREKEFEALKAPLEELAEWREKAAALENQSKKLLEKISGLELDQETLEQTAKEHSEELKLWREKYQSLAQRAEHFESLYEAEKKRREQAEEAGYQASERAERIRQELDFHTQESERGQKKVEELEQNQKYLEEQLSRFSEEQNTEAARLKESNRELTIELEAAQRQARELLTRFEEQQSIEKRARLANELVTKEARLRELALESGQLREEIQECELRAQNLGDEQSNLEREILDIKQAQRYLLEQSKMKEKNKISRPNQARD